MAVDISQSVFGFTSSTSIFAAKLSTTSQISPEQQTAQTSIDASKREINRIRGYKLKLTPSENQQLLKIQERIQEIETKASEGTVRPDEIEERAELYLEADAVIGKPIADIENDETLTKISEQIDELLKPKLNKQDAKRLETLENYQASLETTLSFGFGGRTAELRLQNVLQQIAQIDIPRDPHTLSVDEQRQYNELVEQANEHAGAKILLDVKDSKRVFYLQQSISQLQGLLPPDTSGQPTAADVSRAYTRL